MKGFKRLFKGSKDSGIAAPAAGGSLSAAPHPAALRTPSRSRTIEALSRLQETEELLGKRRDLLEKKIAAELSRARQLTTQGNKKGALAALRRKKLLDGQLEQIENQLQRLAEQTAVLEGVVSTAETISAIQGASQATKETLTQLGPEKVEDILDDINEQMYETNQIHQAMAQPLGAAADIDEAELEDELRELEDAELAQLKALAPSAPAGEAAPAAALGAAAVAAAAAPGVAQPATPVCQPQAAAPAMQQGQRQQRQRPTEEQELEAMMAEMAM